MLELEEMKTSTAIDYEGCGTGNSVNLPSSPLLSVLARIEKMEKLYRKKVKEMLKCLEEIEEWLDSLDDPEIKALCRYRYILGYTWTAVAMRVYRRPAEDAARKRVTRYFESYNNVVTVL